MRRREGRDRGVRSRQSEEARGARSWGARGNVIARRLKESLPFIPGVDIGEKREGRGGKD